MVFSPAHLTMIKDGPAERRKFLDLALCQIRTGYKKLLSDYNRSLAQRNMLLRDIAAGKMSADTLFYLGRQPGSCRGKNHLSAPCLCGCAGRTPFPYSHRSVRRYRSAPDCIQNKHWKVSLDDFGMGENNMNAVYLYTPDIVKLDRSLICGIDNDARKQENVRTYLESFHERGMQVLAEGVETREECDFLRSLGVDLFQGYYLAMPA